MVCQIKDRLNTQEKAALFDKIIEELYVESCHTSGSHDPTHTPKYICELQLARIAKRVLSIVFDIKDFQNPEQINRIPRKGDAYWMRNSEKIRKELSKWKAEGYRPRKNSICSL